MTGEGNVGSGAGDEDNHKLAEEQEEVNHAVQDYDPHQVPHYQVESFKGRFTKVGALTKIYLMSSQIQM